MSYFLLGASCFLGSWATFD